MPECIKELEQKFAEVNDEGEKIAIQIDLAFTLTDTDPQRRLALSQKTLKRKVR